MSFWIKFAITEALSLAALIVDHSGMTSAQKAALEQFIASGNALLALF